MRRRPLALITGASRKIGIGAAIARSLALKGWDIALSYWRPYDESMSWGSDPEEIGEIREELTVLGAEVLTIEADLSKTDSATMIFDLVGHSARSVTALILSHCYSVDSDIFSTTVESFDRHYQINLRASWQLIREMGIRFTYEDSPGRIIALTSDHTAYNLPYGSTKGALDRIVIAAAEELRERHILANVINPGAVDTGWMSDGLKSALEEKSFQKRLGTAEDTARLVTFLCSEEGQWINGQLLYSNGGINY